MICLTEDCGNPVENKDTGLCSSCGHAMRKFERQQVKQEEKRTKQLAKAREKKLQKEYKPIPKISPKQLAYLSRYTKDKQGWLDGKFCAVFPEQRATEVHHKKGRSINSFLDDWARENDIPLLLDKRKWLAVSSDGHAKITRESQWAFDNGFSELRTAI